MIDPIFERRVIQWARANRDNKCHTKGATEVFCESLAYLYGEAEPMLDENGEEIPIAPKEKRPERMTIDRADVDLLDRAYRDRRLADLAKQIIRLRYIQGLSAIAIESRLHMPRKSFKANLEIAMKAFQIVVESTERACQREKKRIR